MGVAKVVLNGDTLIDTTGKTVAADKMLATYTALDKAGNNVTGNIAAKSSSDLTVSGATVTAPAGYYASSASKSVATGTEGTPTATKGTVSNHQVTITPSVTNTTGYITGGTKTGTGVTVTASELASGSKSISANGTGIDVVGYSTVNVAVPSTDFIITVSYNSTTQMWEPDCTMADLWGAYQAGKTIALTPTEEDVAGDKVTVDGYWTDDEVYVYDVWHYYYMSGINGARCREYVWNTNGVTLFDDQTYRQPTGTINITSNGTGIDVANYSTVSVAVPTSTINNQDKTVDPSTEQQAVTADSGYTGLGTVTVNAIPDEYVVPSGDKTITSSGTTDVAGYATASVSQATIPTDTSTTVPLGIINATINANTSDQYLTIPKGYNDARFNYKISKIASGAVSSPVATKGAVSNNSITITPSVTTTTGYITGSTKNGTAVTVNASELVSGTKSITSNGTGIDVTNFASVDVSVGSTILNQNKTVTPTTSQQTVTADSGYTGLGTVTVESMPVGSRGTPLVTRIKTPLLNPTQLTERISDDSATGLTPGYFDSLVYQANFTLENKTVTPSTSTQTITPTSNDYYLDNVTVNPIPSQYIIPTGNIDITSSGTTTVTNYDTATVSAMTLPTAPTTTYTGTKIGSNIGRSTSTRYINIPVGYNDTAKYYQISAVSNMTLPTATSTSATGTSKLTIAPGASTKYLNIPIGYNGTASYYTISPGMTFETGTWTPAEDIARGTISFASTHSSMPLYVCIFDQTQTTHETGSPSYMLYMDEYQIFGATFPSNTNFRYGCITSLFKTDSGTNVYVGTLQYPSTETGNSSTAYPRYWVTESGFYPYSGSTARYWRAGRTYKWLAVWK